MTREPLIITGATGGVGASLTKFLSERFHVIAVARNAREVEELARSCKNVTPCICDLEDPAAGAAFDSLVDEYGDIGYVINNAGVNIRTEVVSAYESDVMRSFTVNVFAPLAIMKKLLPGMKRRNFGRIINITSGAPFNCATGHSLYSASKGALNVLTVTAAKECSNYNIKINLMSPGPVKSKMAPHATLDPSVCHPTVDYLLGLGKEGPTGRFFWLGYELPLFPDLKDVQWMEGKAGGSIKKVVQ
jgi:short-subunit dehydrogenase